MMHSNSNGLKQTANPCLAMALFPVMMANPFYASFVGVSGAMWGMAYVLDRVTSFNSVVLSKRKENRSVLPDLKPAKSVEPSKLQLAAPIASKDAGRTAKTKKANNHKSTNHKGLKFSRNEAGSTR